MRFAKMLNGGVPVVMDVPVYDSSSLAHGELVMRGAHGGTTNSYYITAYTGNNTEAVAALGVLQETPSSVTKNASNGFNYAKCIINPNAVYLAEYFQTSGNIINATNASTSTTVTITNLEDNIDGGWLYATDRVDSDATSAGSLRYLTASASGSCTIDSALTVDTTTDFIKILPVSHRLTALSSDALGLKSQAAAGSGVSLHILENYILKGGVYAPLRYSEHAGLDGLDTATTKFFAAIVLLDHALNQT